LFFKGFGFICHSGIKDVLLNKCIQILIAKEEEEEEEFDTSRIMKIRLLACWAVQVGHVDHAWLRFLERDTHRLRRPATPNFQ